ncbi:hypothetical protein Q3V37_21760 [Micromonospora profundi]|uniref:Uncharacterized protein n=1 Tax=Micromonospora profundi TaxID=1420889 RepID=A0AAJ6HN60_9ACTN|nr:hypothetical protein [Micromonospora profundi]WLS44015.1 hypothetical protein Q3V37_21760 [Micromonospora profundi]
MTRRLRKLLPDLDLRLVRYFAVVAEHLNSARAPRNSGWPNPR